MAIAFSRSKNGRRCADRADEGLLTTGDDLDFIAHGLSKPEGGGTRPHLAKE